MRYNNNNIVLLLWIEEEKGTPLLVDFNLGAFAGQIGYAHPVVGQSAPDAIVARLLENGLHVHGEFDPVVGRFSGRDRGEYGCQSTVDWSGLKADSIKSRRWMRLTVIAFAVLLEVESAVIRRARTASVGFKIKEAVYIIHIHVQTCSLLTIVIIRTNFSH